MLKFVPISLPDKIFNTLIFNVIKGEKRVAQIEVRLHVRHGENQASAYVIRPKQLRYNPDFQKAVMEFAPTVFELYEYKEDDPEGWSWFKKRKG